MAQLQIGMDTLANLDTVGFFGMKQGTDLLDRFMSTSATPLARATILRAHELLQHQDVVLPSRRFV